MRGDQQYRLEDKSVYPLPFPTAKPSFASRGKTLGDKIQVNIKGKEALKSSALQSPLLLVHFPGTYTKPHASSVSVMKTTEYNGTWNTM